MTARTGTGASRRRRAAAGSAATGEWQHHAAVGRAHHRHARADVEEGQRAHRRFDDPEALGKLTERRGARSSGMRRLYRAPAGVA